MNLCFATNNKHKLEEVSLAVGESFTILGLKEIGVLEALPETSDTLEGNSLQKARFVFDKAKIPCFADDSGLEVTALNGAPGVSSAMYAGDHRSDEDNIQLLLKNLDGARTREATFRTIIALVGMGETKLFEGSIKGTILHEQRGTNGFGYDPVFLPHGSARTFAEMTMIEKNLHSHRSIAVEKLVAYLKQLPRD